MSGSSRLACDGPTGPLVLPTGDCRLRLRIRLFLDLTDRRRLLDRDEAVDLRVSTERGKSHITIGGACLADSEVRGRMPRLSKRTASLQNQSE